MSGQPCNVCGIGLVDLTPGHQWCPACGTIVKHRGLKNETAEAPMWSDPEQLDGFLASLIANRDKLLLVIKELEETREMALGIFGDLPTDPEEMTLEDSTAALSLQANLLGNRAAWIERITVVLREITGPDDEKLMAEMVTQAVQSGPADHRIELAARGILQEAKMGSMRAIVDRITVGMSTQEREAVLALVAKGLEPPFYCPEHLFRPEPGSGFAFCPECEGRGGVLENRCPHDKDPSECEACFKASDVANDEAQERRAFGGGS